ncbi:MAG: phosphoenolpyruvate carboxylase [Myxococcales bacterium]
MSAAQDTASLEADIALLTTRLDATIAELSDPAVLELVRSLRDDAVAMRKGTLPGGREHFHQRIAALNVEQLADVARAFTQWFHLVNAAEEQHRVRLLRRHDREHPPEDSIANALTTMVQAGMSADDVRAQLKRLFVMPVLTAHPTEARRRTVRDHVAEVKRLLDGLERPWGPRARDEMLEKLDYSLMALYGTEESRVTKPTPRDELEAGLDVFKRTLLDATPLLYREIEDSLARLMPAEDWLGLAPSDGAQWAIPSFLRWGTWIGGDRDGNPFVTAHVTRMVLERQRSLILDRYLADVDALGRGLSLSSRRMERSQGLIDLESSIARDRERFPEIAARVQKFTVYEPWREKLWYVAARLRATKARADEAYVDPAGYQRDLVIIERALVSSGHKKLALGLLRDCRRRADTFGFHLASLDLRQHSGVHEQAVAELLANAGLSPRGRYTDLDEEERCALLHELLARPESLAPASRASLSSETQDLLATLDMVGRARREQGPRACERYIVSFTSTLSDLLEVLFLQRSAGLAPGELRPVPLLEQLEDLENGPKLAEQMLASAPIRAAIGGELEVMLGYSDSCKQVGYVASQVALRKAQHGLADVIERHPQLLLTIFHGRGGAIGRGGGPSHHAIRAQPERALRGRMRVTEQGETVTARYGRLDIARRDLEQVVSAVLLSSVTEQAPLPKAELKARDEALDEAARSALKAYDQLIGNPDRLSRYVLAATPIGEVAALPIGSRPASRKASITLGDLRAIPWVFSWNQSRHGVPGWFGLGAALETMIAERGAPKLQELYRVSPFFRALVNNAQLALSRADIEVAAFYARLADEDAQAIFPLIRAEWDRTVKAVLDIIESQEILGNRPHLLSTVHRRNPYVDVLSHTQIELRRRLLAGPADREREQLLSALFITINGIAAGLQSAG